MASSLNELVEQLIERMEQEDYITIDQPHDPARSSTVGGQVGDAQSQARFEITDKGLDFLGFRALRDLLGSLGKSSFGRHDTRDTATGIEASGASKTYEFGDTMNLDITATLSNAIQREGLHSPAEHRVQRSAGASVRISIVVRDRAHARLLALHDSVRRGPLHAGQESCDGVVASHPHAISGRLALAGALPRFGGGVATVATGAGQSGPVLHQHARRAAAWRSAFCNASART